MQHWPKPFSFAKYSYNAWESIPKNWGFQNKSSTTQHCRYGSCVTFHLITTLNIFQQKCCKKCIQESFDWRCLSPKLVFKYLKCVKKGEEMETFSTHFHIFIYLYLLQFLHTITTTYLYPFLILHMYMLRTRVLRCSFFGWLGFACLPFALGVSIYLFCWMIDDKMWPNT